MSALPLEDSITAEWYLWKDGKALGPYRAKQIVVLLEQGEIAPDQKILSNRLPKGEWITAIDLTSALRELRGSTPALPTARPQIDESSDTTQVYHAASDPTLGLFQMLEVARQKRTSTKLAASDELEPGQFSRPQPKIPSQTILIAALGLLGFIFAWGITSVFKSTSKPVAIEGRKGEGSPKAQSDSSTSAQHHGHDNKPPSNAAQVNQLFKKPPPTPGAVAPPPPPPPPPPMNEPPRPMDPAEAPPPPPEETQPPQDQPPGEPPNPEEPPQP